MNAVVRHEGQVDQLPATSEQATILSMIDRAARDPEVDIDKLERLMQMRERMESRQAEQSFNAAMTSAQSAMGRIAANADNSQTRSKYATYGKLDSVLRPIYTQHGFSLSFGTGDGAPEGCVRVECLVAHADGYSRRYHCDMPNDGKGAKGGDVMTKTHATGAAMSYGMRYLLKMIFNVAVGEDDDDGNGATVDPAWLDAIKDASDTLSLKAIKAEMVKKFGGNIKIPKPLVRAYNERLHELDK